MQVTPVVPLWTIAHPTAFMVNAIFSVEADAGLRDVFFEDGVAMATDSPTTIRNFILTYYPEPGTATS